MNNQQFVQMARTLSPDDWLELLIDPGSGPLKFAEHLPKLPPDDIQIATAGKSGVGTMRETLEIYKKVIGIYIAGVGKMEDTFAVDFGCGCGRITRFF